MKKFYVLQNNIFMFRYILLTWCCLSFQANKVLNAVLHSRNACTVNHILTIIINT